MTETILTPTEANFAETVKEGITVVDFWATWCGPCRMIAPILDEIATEQAGKIKVAKVNVDEEMGLAHQFGVMSIPTLLFFKDGKLMETIVGVRPKEDILAQIEKLA